MKQIRDRRSLSQNKGNKRAAVYVPRKELCNEKEPLWGLCKGKGELIS